MKMELYFIGIFFMYGVFLDQSHKHPGWKDTIKMILGCLVWPVVLGGIIAPYFRGEDQEETE